MSYIMKYSWDKANVDVPHAIFFQIYLSHGCASCLQTVGCQCSCYNKKILKLMAHPCLDRNSQENWQTWALSKMFPLVWSWSKCLQKSGPHQSYFHHAVFSYILPQIIYWKLFDWIFILTLWFQVSFALYVVGTKSHHKSSSLRPHVSGSFIQDWYF